jgi:hypothetical protein
VHQLVLGGGGRAPQNVGELFLEIVLELLGLLLGQSQRLRDPDLDSFRHDVALRRGFGHVTLPLTLGSS